MPDRYITLTARRSQRIKNAAKYVCRRGSAQATAGAYSSTVGLEEIKREVKREGTDRKHKKERKKEEVGVGGKGKERAGILYLFIYLLSIRTHSTRKTKEKLHSCWIVYNTTDFISRKCITCQQWGS